MCYGYELDILFFFFFVCRKNKKGGGEREGKRDLVPLPLLLV